LTHTENALSGGIVGGALGHIHPVGVSRIKGEQKGHIVGDPGGNVIRGVGEGKGLDMRAVEVVLREDKLGGPGARNEVEVN